MDKETKSSPECIRSEKALAFINQVQMLYPKEQLIKDVKAKVQYIRMHGDMSNSDVIEQILMFEEVGRILVNHSQSTPIQNNFIPDIVYSQQEGGNISNFRND